jgi:hypothetical protein
VPERVLTVRLDGSTEYQTSDGDDPTAGDEVMYLDIDLELRSGPDGVKGYHRRNGTPYLFSTGTRQFGSH